MYHIEHWLADLIQSLEDLLHLQPPSISQTPFYAHLLSSLPSLRLSIKDAVTASTKSWLFDVRESGAKVGMLALDQMTNRIKKWKAKRERDGGVRLARVGGALELVYNERSGCELSSAVQWLNSFDMDTTDNVVDALNNDEIKIDFRPLFQCVHIHEALDAKPELQRNYQQDRKVSFNSPQIAAPN